MTWLHIMRNLSITNFFTYTKFSVSTPDPKMTIKLVTKLHCSSLVCMCDSRTNHSSRFTLVAGSKIERILYGIGYRYQWKSVLKTMTHVTGFWYQLAGTRDWYPETGWCVMGLNAHQFQQHFNLTRTEHLTWREKKQTGQTKVVTAGKLASS